MREAGILYCNCCGKKIPEGYSRETEDFFHFEKTWGYFSGKDGTRQTADICEFCMEQWIAQFRIPPQTVERTGIFECSMYVYLVPVV